MRRGETSERHRNGIPDAARLMQQDVRDRKRARLIDAAIWLASERGTAATTVAAIGNRAGVARKAFYEIFDDREDCLASALASIVDLAAQDAVPAYHGEQQWVDQVRAGLFALLRFFDQHPRHARFCLIEGHATTPIALAQRQFVLAQLAWVVDGGRRDAAHQPPRDTAHCVVGGMVSLIEGRLQAQPAAQLTELLTALMAFLVLPYRGVDAAAYELARPLPPVPQAKPVPRPRALQDLGIRLTHRTIMVLAAIAEQPGLSNREVCRRAEIADPGQASKLLHRLERLVVIENTGAGHAAGGSNAWRLTDYGREINAHVQALAYGKTTT
jgi:AcrR family transcriptional regulator/DNA-binding MarR family transcriptional regulator